VATVATSGPSITTGPTSSVAEFLQDARYRNGYRGAPAKKFHEATVSLVLFARAGCPRSCCALHRLDHMDVQADRNDVLGSRLRGRSQAWC